MPETELLLLGILIWFVLMGHDQLLEIRLLKKTAQHDFAFTRQCSSKQLI